MKKYLIIAAASSLLFIGCAKVDPAAPNSGEQHVDPESVIPPAKDFKKAAPAAKLVLPDDEGIQK